MRSCDGAIGDRAEIPDRNAGPDPAGPVSGAVGDMADVSAVPARRQRPGPPPGGGNGAVFPHRKAAPDGPHLRGAGAGDRRPGI